MDSFVVASYILQPATIASTYKITSCRGNTASDFLQQEELQTRVNTFFQIKARYFVWVQMCTQRPENDAPPPRTRPLQLRPGTRITLPQILYAPTVENY